MANSQAHLEPGSPLGKATSLTLLERARAREPEAWERLMRLYAPLVASWCACGGVRGADAEDVVQEVFGAAARGLGRFRRERPEDSFRGWLRGITKLKLREHFRRAGRQPRAGGGSASVGLQEVADPTVELPEEDSPTELRDLYRRALQLIRGAFEERTWQMFWLTVIEDRPTADVAAEYGVTAAAVRKARSRVLHRLKEEVGDLIA